MKCTPGTFYDHGSKQELVTLTRAADITGKPLHDVQDAVADGRLSVVVISGCKAVAFVDLMKLVAEGGK
jgi:hypothetical protein